MKPDNFRYIRAKSLDDAFAALDRYGADARVIAGGQSLVPMLNFRLARPEALIDINGLAELSGISENGDAVTIGALTRHVMVERSDIIARRVPLVAEAMTHVAHPAVRNRGTFGGSLCLADPAAELPACMVALSATMSVAGSGGRRTIGADDFFCGMFETGLADGEMLIEVSVPSAGPTTRSAMDEISRRHGDYAIVGAAAVATVTENRFDALRLVFFGVEDRPIVAGSAAEVAVGHEYTPQRAAILRASLASDLSPNDDQQASSAMRLHLAGVLADRLYARLAGVPVPGPGNQAAGGIT